jgi:FAD:protein FMN transferase
VAKANILPPRLLAALAFALAARAGTLEKFEAVEPHMGTLVHIVVYARDKPQAAAAFARAFSRIEALDGILSDYKPDSELNRLCRERDMRVSPDLFNVLAMAQRIAYESGGAFDITAAPIIHLWREARRTGTLPSPEAIREARSHTGWQFLTLNQGTKQAHLAEPASQLDLGGLAKGYVAQQAANTLRKSGIRSALVAASGDIFAFGPRNWPVTLELVDGTRDIQLRNAAVSTAGDTEQHMTIGSTRYSHIIDPRTGEALTQPIGVSVVAKNGLEADALDTAISVLGRERGLELLKRHHPRAAALIVAGRQAVEFNSRRLVRVQSGHAKAGPTAVLESEDSRSGSGQPK